MNLKARHKAFKIFSGARPDVERIRAIWNECLDAHGGPFLFGPPTIADTAAGRRSLPKATRPTWAKAIR